MKKNYIFTLLITLCLTAVSFGQEMILNGGLENWDDDTTPTSWTKAEVLTKSTDAHSGSFSAVRDGGSGTKDLSQTISGVIPGNSYTISFWYKVTAGDEEDVRIWSNWKSGDTFVYHVGDVNDRSNDPLRGPEDGYLDDGDGVWTKHEVTVTAPADVDSFYFEVRSYSNSTTYWDDLSFVNNGTASVKDNSIEGFATYPNPVTNNKFTVTSSSSNRKEIAIFNVLGGKVFSSTVSGVKSTVDVSSISSGIYILKVTEDGKTATKKLVLK
ncbi:Por secretion system C-terminal sorting domain-containing protein [Polaribacter sp. KT25b]|uniref:T9SS type A sorting domain-containing protein n=1 Tax=Polaribacter sp. KT25b TaxID=1855336 RepID=UPI0008792233|nr:T9SS type A sorting domain-containing protein [Polaribacter sp. KT25b]SDS38536.1 Por secretion system C-terminal sorting domain-containing protein [Polaribacter sp. KT25b]